MDEESTDEKRLESLLRRGGRIKLSSISLVDAITKMYGLGNSIEYPLQGNEKQEIEETEQYHTP
ncbi:hypothetical protein HYT51_00595 [Candidatus Woesearchaeota archaeon]|nr:hypothetical protein [Candidatus Woesearchaeota archaeon]